jgi:hypothetical protein
MGVNTARTLYTVRGAALYWWGVALYWRGAALQGASGIDAHFSKLAFSSEEWDREMKFGQLIIWSLLYTVDVEI